MRRQTRLATRVEAILARAPRPASRPDQINRLTKGLSVIEEDSIRLAVGWAGSVGTVYACYPSSPRQIVSTIKVFARSNSSSETGSTSKIHPVSTCSTQP
jgi:hypothetical protein